METLAINTNEKLSAKDFSSGTDVKWCPGCGDYSILKQVEASEYKYPHKVYKVPV